MRCFACLVASCGQLWRRLSASSYLVRPILARISLETFARDADGGRYVPDGRGHSQVVISDKHAQVAESLLIAQEVSREGISARNKERERQQRIEKEKKDEQLRQVRGAYCC